MIIFRRSITIPIFHFILTRFSFGSIHFQSKSTYEHSWSNSYDYQLPGCKARKTEERKKEELHTHIHTERERESGREREKEGESCEDVNTDQD